MRKWTVDRELFEQSRRSLDEKTAPTETTLVETRVTFGYAIEGTHFEIEAFRHERAGKVTLKDREVFPVRRFWILPVAKSVYPFSLDFDCIPLLFARVYVGLGEWGEREGEGMGGE